MTNNFIDPNVVANLIEFIGLPIVLFLIFLLAIRRFNIYIPILNPRKEKFAYDLVDEAHYERYYEIAITDLKIMGKFTYFVHKGTYYFVVKDRQTKRKGCQYSRYQMNNPYPLPIDGESSDTPSEIKEMAESKVVFDLLRFTLSNVETGILMLLAANMILTGVSIYFGYSASNGITQTNTLLSQIVHYLFPSAAPGQT